MRSVPRLLLAALSLAGALCAQAPVPIAEVVLDADGDGIVDRVGETFVVRGEVTAAPFRARRSGADETRLYIQDDGAGIRVTVPQYERLTPFRVGVSVTCEGRLEQYNGMPVLNLRELLGVGPATGVEATPVDPRAYDGEALCGKLVTFHGPVFYDEQRYYIGEGPNRVRLFLTEANGLVPFTAQFQDGFEVAITGVLEQFDSTAPFLTGYRVRPRDETDVVVGVPLLARPEFKVALVVLLSIVAALLGWLAFRSWRAKSQLESPQVQRIQSLGTMASGIAHEFNNYLLAIGGFAELARGELPVGAPARAHIDEVLAAAGRAKALIEQILSYSAAEDREMVPVDAREAMEEGMRLLGAMLPATVQLVERLDSGAGMFRVDRGQLNQVLLNLGTNASHAMPQGGTLCVELRRQVPPADKARALGLRSSEPHAMIEVRDTGVGMTEDVRQRVFDPFFTTRERSEGTGLGLSVVQGIVKRHGGAIEVDSVVGEGTTFRVYLPLAAAVEQADFAAAEAASPAQAAPRDLGGCRALVVDDQRNLAVLVQKMLARMGFEVVVSTDGEDAARRAVDAPRAFDLIVSDLTMPRVDGLELCRRARAGGVNAPFLLITGNASTLEEGAWRNAGVTALLTKPFSPEELQAEVAKLLPPAQSAM
ncbi:MAG: ATP-binding protein [Planctomycetota bacterium]